MSKGWDNAALKKLKALTGKGLSTAEIGKRLGMSKNAVVGKLNRLGWNLKAGGVDSVTEAKPVEKKNKTAVATVAPKKAAVTKKPVVATKVIKKAAPVKAPAKKVIVAPKKAEVPAKSKNTVKTAAKSVTPKDLAKESKLNSKNLAMHQRIIQHSLGMAGLRTDQCRWPIGDPDSEHFHFCGDPVFVGKPYCYEHCKQAYQFVPSKKKQG